MRTSVAGVDWHARVRVAMAVCAVVALAPHSFSQEQGAETQALVLEGFVLAPDGIPAAGAVVVSSAGGKAVTDAAGRYRLTVRALREAACVQVTALGAAGGSLAASASVAVTKTGTAFVDPLQLVRGATCSPSWLPTFGQEPGTDGTVYATAVYDGGTGPALYVGGDFSTAGGMAASHVAKWDGSSWSALGSGMSNGGVNSLLVHDDGTGPALYAGGGFESALDSLDSHLAKWGCLDTTPPTLFAPASVQVADRFGSLPGELVVFSVTASDDRDPAPSVVCVPPSGSFFSMGTTLVTCTATDASGNQATCQFPVTVQPKVRQRGL